MSDGAAARRDAGNGERSDDTGWGPVLGSPAMSSPCTPVRRTTRPRHLAARIWVKWYGSNLRTESNPLFATEQSCSGAPISQPADPSVDQDSNACPERRIGTVVGYTNETSAG